jgi:hypothetical protein
MPSLKALLLCGFLFSFSHQVLAATCTGGVLPPGDGSDLEVTGPCTVPAGIYLSIMPDQKTWQSTSNRLIK